MTIDVTCSSPGCGRGFAFEPPVIPSQTVASVAVRAVCPHCGGPTVVSVSPNRARDEDAEAG